jgi:hypothetical protein
MLVAVDEQGRVRTLDVIAEGGKAVVDTVRPVMQPARRVVGDEDVHRRKAGQSCETLGRPHAKRQSVAPSK